MLNADHKAFIKAIQAAAGRQRASEVLTDFAHMAALEIRATFVMRGKVEIMADWQRTRANYTDKEYAHLVEASQILIESLEERREEFLGSCMEELGATNTHNGQFLVIHVASYNLCTTHDSTHYSTNAHHTTANNHDSIGIDHLCTADGMETDRHRLDDGSMLYCDVANGDDLLPGNGDIFTHGTIALYSQCLVVLTSVVTSVLARRAVAAVGIWVDGDCHSGLQVCWNRSTYFCYLGTNLMTRNNRHLHHGVQSAVSIQVAAAEAYIMDAKQHLIGTALRFLDIYHLGRLGDLYCFHLSVIFYFRFNVVTI